jgi:GNAT superfamily N-acetyltransferase
MTRVLEDTFQVDIPHPVGERLNTVGETVDHLAGLRKARRETSGVRIETVFTKQQWAEMSGIRTLVFTGECGFSFQSLPGPGETGIWHLLARDNHDAIGTLSIVDTTADNQVHERYNLSFGDNDRVARYAQLAILKPHRKRGVFEMLMEAAQRAVIRPNGFTIGWLLYPAPYAQSSVLTHGMGFNARAPLLTTEFGQCHILVRKESSPPRANGSEEIIPHFRNDKTDSYLRPWIGIM